MPKLDGFTACREIHVLQQGKAIPILIVSGLLKKKFSPNILPQRQRVISANPIDWLKLLKKIASL